MYDNDTNAAVERAIAAVSRHITDNNLEEYYGEAIQFCEYVNDGVISIWVVGVETEILHEHFIPESDFSDFN